MFKPLQLFLLFVISFIIKNEVQAISPDTNTGSDNLIQPVFFFSPAPALLIFIDGTPVFKQENSDLLKVINSDTLILFSKKEKRFYIKAAYRWFISAVSEKTDIQHLTWDKNVEIPKDLKSYIQTLPKTTVDINKLKIIPDIFISSKPAELLQATGKPIFTSIPRTELSFVQNSDNDLFRYERNKQFYLLVSGRWFTTKRLKGKWKYIKSQNLPNDFKEIPFNSRKWHILSCIAETQAAQEAIKNAEVSTKITVKRIPRQLNHFFKMPLQFLPLKNTRIEYAVNTVMPILKFQNKYYTCISAVWYSSKDLQQKWKVATKIPDIIYKIPPTSFLYYITFVKIAEVDEQKVEFAYTAGYEHSFVENGSIVYGTGYQYLSMWKNHWYPRPRTYGYNIAYNPFEHQWERCNRYSENDNYHVQWQSENKALKISTPSIISGNYIGPFFTVQNDKTELLPTFENDSEEDDNTQKRDTIKDDFTKRQAGDWDSMVTEASLDPPKRQNSAVIHSAATTRISNREKQSSNRVNTGANSRQRGISLFERYRTYNSKSLKQSYGGGRLRTGTINSRGQFRGTLKK